MKRFLAQKHFLNKRDNNLHTRPKDMELQCLVLALKRNPMSVGKRVIMQQSSQTARVVI